MIDLETHGQRHREGVNGRFNYELQVFKQRILEHTITGQTFGPTLRNVTERLEAEWAAKGVDEAILRVYGPYYAENRLAPESCGVNRSPTLEAEAR
jgi:hypothetical protein